MTDAYPTPIVSTDWLADHLDDPKVVVLDSSYHLPTVKRDAATEFQGLRIPGARFFDFDGRIKDPDADQPHMLCSPDRFEREVGALGVSNDTFVVSYDVNGIFSASRCWWMFRTFGHEKVAVLDGGLPKWEHEGRPVETTPPAPVKAAKFKASFHPHLVRSAQHVLDALDTADIIDARSAGRFLAQDPEPRPGLRSGHIPGSFNIPFQKILSDKGTLKSAQELKEVFTGAGIDLENPIICSCGSGVSACNLALGLYVLGREDAAVYDGSWSEWGSRDDLPIET